MKSACYFCHIKTVEHLINKFRPSSTEAEKFILSIHNILTKNWEMPNPLLAREVHKKASLWFNNNELYKEEKHRANQILMKEYTRWKAMVTYSDDPFHTAAKLSVVGNVIDYGAHTATDDVLKLVGQYLQKDLKLDAVQQLKKGVEHSRSILYIGDNAGEIVFDKLFIETMQHPNLTYVVRGDPVINDVTMYDACQIGMDKVCRVIPNGFDAPSTILSSCSDEFNECYDKADLVISKGQGNFEGLMGFKDPRLFFMLMAKCKPIASLLGINIGEMAICKQHELT